MKKLLFILFSLVCSIQFGMAQEFDSLFYVEKASFVRSTGNSFHMCIRPKFEENTFKGKAFPQFSLINYEYHNKVLIETFQNLFSIERRQKFQETLKENDINSLDIEVLIDNKGTTHYCEFRIHSWSKFTEPEEIFTTEEWSSIYAAGRKMNYDLTKHKVDCVVRYNGDVGEMDYRTKEYDYRPMSFDLSRHMK